jgi:hypothetical protein
MVVVDVACSIAVLINFRLVSMKQFQCNCVIAVSFECQNLSMQHLTKD